MSFRINTNTQAARSLSSLSSTTSEIGQRQLRLSTGSRINSAAEDSAGFTISNKLTATTRGQAQALSNIGDAKSMLTVAEGALGTTMDILQTMKEKAVQAGNSSMGTQEREAIQSQINELTKEVGDILGGADFNGTALFSDTGDTDLTFQVGDASGDTFDAEVGQMGVSTLGIGTIAAAGDAAAAVPSSATVGTATDNSGNGFAAGDVTLGGEYTGATDFAALEFTVANAGDSLTYDAGGGTQTLNKNSDGKFVFQGSEIEVGANGQDTDSFEVAFVAGKDAVEAGDVQAGLNVMSNEGVGQALTTIDAAISKVNKSAQGLGDSQNRLDFKAQNLETSKTNYEAANSRIKDADFAKEQMEIVKLQILQQTGSAMFAQANSSGQSVLSFF